VLCILQAVSCIGIDREPDGRKFLAHGGDVFEIFSRLDLQLDALISTAEFLFDFFH